MEEGKVEQISESTLGTKSEKKMWNLASKGEENVEGAVLGTFNNMQGYMQFGLDYFCKSRAGELLNLCSKARKCSVAVFTASTLTCCSEGCGGVQDPTNNGQEQ